MADGNGQAGAARPRAAAAPDMLQLLAFVFASADLVLEIADEGEVTFATGAAMRLLGRPSDALVGAPWQALLQPAETAFLEAALAGIGPGERRGPFRLGLAGPSGVQPGTLSLFQVPQRAGRTAVAISLSQPSFAALTVDEAGFAPRTEFEAAAETLVRESASSGQPLHIDLLEFAGLSAAVGRLPPDEAMRTRCDVAAMLRAASYGGLPATSLGGDRYALVRAGGDLTVLSEKAQAVAGPSVQILAAQLAFNPTAPLESLRAIRYAIDRCIENGPAAAASGFEAALRKTVDDSNRFKALLSEGRFEVVYQPIVELKSRRLHHYEALVRFAEGEDTASTIKLAEELGLVSEFDLAILKTVIAAVRDRPPEVRVAVNISAYSLQKPGFVDDLLAATGRHKGLRARLLLELTESHELGDLDAANQSIQRLRTAGHEVCLDDFGAGSASLDYLRRLETDVVKFDGRFIQAVLTQERDALLLRRLAELCHELGIVTVAEMVETEEVAQALTELGIGLGQGWLLGRPLAKPQAPLPAGPSAARRKGSVESWG